MNDPQRRDRTTAYWLLVCSFACLLGGCSRAKAPAPSASPPGQNEQVAPHPAKQADELPRPEPLTRDLIQGLPDDLLEQGAATQVEYLLRQIPGSEEDAAKKLPRGMRMIYTTINLQAEVDNGGFNQYFWNTQGKLNREALADLELIGAHRYARLFEEAIKQARKEAPMRDRFRRIGTPDAFSRSYTYTHLDAYDTRFFKLEQKYSLTKLRAAYIRAHPDEFIIH